MTPSKTVIGLVESHAQAEIVVDALREDGFASDDLSAVFPDQSSSKDFADRHRTQAPAGAVAGVGAGGAIGGTVGLFAGIGALAIPGLGPFIAAGPLLAAFTGAAAGAALGGLTGALIGLGIPESDAQQLETKIKGGHILISVHAADSDWVYRANQVLEIHGATHITTVGEVPTTPPPAP
jgi:hypothetical protein